MSYVSSASSSSVRGSSVPPQPSHVGALTQGMANLSLSASSQKLSDLLRTLSDPALEQEYALSCSRPAVAFAQLGPDLEKDAKQLKDKVEAMLIAEGFTWKNVRGFQAELEKALDPKTNRLITYLRAEPGADTLVTKLTVNIQCKVLVESHEGKHAIVEFPLVFPYPLDNPCSLWDHRQDKLVNNVIGIHSLLFFL